MFLSNLINMEAKSLCLHEGYVRHLETKGSQILPPMILQNHHAYQSKAESKVIFQRMRGQMVEQRDSLNLRLFGDVGYYYIPFLHIIPKVFPQSRAIVMFRHGQDFVRSACVNAHPDPLPIGWPEKDAQLTPIERFIGLGRLRPLASDAVAGQWPRLSSFERNCWLWAESNRLILDAIRHWSRHSILFVRFEELIADPVLEYRRIREFLGAEGRLPKEIKRILSRPINRRPLASYALPPPRDWSLPQVKIFANMAGETMEALGYELQGPAS